MIICATSDNTFLDVREAPGIESALAGVGVDSVSAETAVVETFDCNLLCNLDHFDDHGESVILKVLPLSFPIWIMNMMMSAL